MDSNSPESPDSRVNELRMAISVLVQFQKDHVVDFLPQAIEFLESLYPGKLTVTLNRLDEAIGIEDEEERLIEINKLRSNIIVSVSQLNPYEFSAAMKE